MPNLNVNLTPKHNALIERVYAPDFEIYESAQLRIAPKLDNPIPFLAPQM